MKSLRLLAVIAAAVALTLLVQAALAGPSAQTVSIIAGKNVSAIKVVRSADLISTKASTWQNVPGASTSIMILSNTSGLILVRFSAVANLLANPNCGCGQIAQGLTRVLVGGIEAEPSTGPTAAFLTARTPEDENPNDPYLAGRPTQSEIDRSAGPLPAGVYQVQVQWMVVDISNPSVVMTFDLSDWSLTVERVQA